MKTFRRNYLSRAFSLITGVLFLNMSFFLVEVSLLEITDHQIIENIARLISTGGFEGERDGETPEKDSAKEVDLIVELIQAHHQAVIIVASKSGRMPDDLYPHANYSQTFSPPPDSILYA